MRAGQPNDGPRRPQPLWQRRFVKITAVRATCLAVPFRRPESWAEGKRRGVNNILVEIETDQGVVGLGEATCGSGGSPEPVRAVIEAFAPHLLGGDPRLIHRHVGRFGSEARWRLWRDFSNTALAAIESALWDILGKSLALPVHQLLGGRIRDRVPVFGYVMHDTPDAMAMAAEAMVRQGFRTIYVKVGLTAEQDEQAVRAVREGIGPAARLRIDANEAWDQGEALRRITRLSRHGLDLVEQPVPRDDIAGLAALRRKLPVPVAANQSCWAVEDVLAVIRQDAADVMVAGLHWLGGIDQMRRAAALCDSASIPFCRHSSGELGVATAAGLHALAVMPLLDDGNQSYFSHWPHDILAGAPMALVDGCHVVPDGPGLGVELDRAAVDELAARYRRDGPFLPEAPGG